MMFFEWDEDKNAENRRKHGVDFEVAAQVFADPLQVATQDRDVDGEERWQTIGMVKNLVVLLLVCHTYEDEQGDEVLRIISARRADSHEWRRYEENF